MVRDSVIGSGATALAYALFRARYARVQLYARSRRLLSRSIESVPAPALALLLELGITPEELGVRSLNATRITAWEDADPVEHEGPSCAHLDTGALYEALRRRTQSCPDISVHHHSSSAPKGTKCVDATGRSAATAQGRCRPPRVWTAASVTSRSVDTDGALRLASAADGYAYRLGSSTWTTVGWVAPGRPPRSAAELRNRIEHAGAAWLLAGCQLPDSAPTDCRPASVAIPLPSGRAIPIGDAALSRDAMASQGVSIGLSDACLLADPATTATSMAARRGDAAQRHLRHLAGVVVSCRHADSRAWSPYRGWLQQVSASDGCEVARPHVYQ